MLASAYIELNPKFASGFTKTLKKQLESTNADGDGRKIGKDLAKGVEAGFDPDINVDGIDGAAEEGRKAGDEAGKSFEASFKPDVSGALKSAFKGAAGIAASAAGLVGSIMGVTSANEEQVQSMGQLEVAWTSQGKTVEQAQAAYKSFYGLIGEVDTATEAANNLARMARSEQDLAAWTNISAGAFATFADALPVENLVEAAQETASTGIVVGGMADALNWSTASLDTWNAGLSTNSAAQAAFNTALDQGMSREDAFNAALAACANEQERSALITSTLNSLYGEAGQAYQDLNGDLITSRQAQADFNQTMGDVATSLMPAKNAILEIGSMALTALMPAFQTASTALQTFADALSGGATPVEAFKAAFSTLPEDVQKAVTAFAALGGAIGVAMAGGKIAGLANSFKGIASALSGIIGKGAAAAADMTATAVASKAAGAGAAMSATQMLALAASVVALGAGVLLASAGLALLAQSAIQLASAGPGAAVAMVGLVAAIAGLAAGAALVGPALTAGAVGLVAFGAAIALVGVGILAATTGIANLAMTLPLISAYGGTAAVAMQQLALAALALAPGLLLIAPSVLLLSTSLAIVSAAAMVFATAMLLASTAVVVAAAGLALMATSLPLIAAATPTAAVALAALATAALMAAPGILALSAPMALLAVELVAAAAALTVMSAAMLLLSAGITVAAAGLTVIATAMPLIASAAPAAAAALASLAVAATAAAPGLLLISPAVVALSAAFAVAAASALVFSAAVMVISAGVMVAAAGITLMAAMLPTIAASAAAAGAALTVFATAALMVSPGLVAAAASCTVLAAGAVALAAGLVAVTAALTAATVVITLAAAAITLCAAGMTLLATATTMLAAAVMVVAAGLTAMAAALPAVASAAPAAAAGLTAFAAAAAASSVGILAATPALTAFAAAAVAAAAGITAAAVGTTVLATGTMMIATTGQMAAMAMTMLATAMAAAAPLIAAAAPALTAASAAAAASAAGLQAAGAGAAAMAAGFAAGAAAAAALSAAVASLQGSTASAASGFSALSAAVTAAMAAAIAAVQSGMASMVAAIQAGVQSFVAAIQAGMANVASTFTAGWASAQAATVSSWAGINAAVSSGIAQMMGQLSGIRGQITGYFAGAGSWLYSSGVAIVQGLASGISASSSLVTSAMARVMAAAKAYTPSSPAEKGAFSGKGWTEYSGVAINQGLADGIDKSAGLPAAAMARAIGAVHKAVSFGSSVWGVYSSSVNDAAERLDDTASTMSALAEPYREIQESDSSALTEFGQFVISLSDGVNDVVDRNSAVRKAGNLFKRAGVKFSNSFIEEVLTGSEGYIDHIDEMSSLTDEQLQGIVNAYEDVRMAEKEQETAARSLQVAMLKYGDTKTVRESIDDYRNVVLDLKEELYSNDGLNKAFEAAGLSLEDFSADVMAFGTDVETVMGTVSDFATTVADGFNAMSTEDQVGLSEFNENLENNILQAREWRDDVEKVFAQIGDWDGADAFKQAVLEGGYEKYGKLIADMADATGYQIWSTVQLYNVAMETGAKTGIESVSAIIEQTDTERFKALGMDISAGIAQGIRDGEYNVTDAMQSVCAASEQTVTSYFGIASPSKLMAKLFGYVGQGAAVGIERSASSVKRAMQRLSSGVERFAGSHGLGAMLDSGGYSGGGSTTVNNQTVNFNGGVNSPAAYARQLRMQQRYGLAGAR